MQKPYLLLLPLISLWPNSSSQSVARLEILCTDHAGFVVTDPLGRRTGDDWRYGKSFENRTQFREDPGAAYHLETMGDGAPDYMQYEKGISSTADDGVYRIQFIGNKLGTFDFYVSVNPHLTKMPIHKAYFSKKRIPIDKDSTVSFVFSYHLDRNAPVNLSKIVSIQSLAHDLRIMRKLNWILDTSLADKYEALIDTCARQIQHRNVIDARSTLSRILQNITADSSHALTNDACTSLRPDVQQLLHEL
jgi:hypothetical protein